LFIVGFKLEKLKTFIFLPITRRIKFEVIPMRFGEYTFFGNDSFGNLSFPAILFATEGTFIALPRERLTCIGAVISEFLIRRRVSDE